MDENKNPESRYDVDEEEGATTVLRAMDAETEDEEEGATTVLRAEDMTPEDDDDTEGATTVLTVAIALLSLLVSVAKAAFDAGWKISHEKNDKSKKD